MKLSLPVPTTIPLELLQSPLAEFLEPCWNRLELPMTRRGLFRTWHLLLFREEEVGFNGIGPLRRQLLAIHMRNTPVKLGELSHLARFWCRWGPSCVGHHNHRYSEYLFSLVDPDWDRPWRFSDRLLVDPRPGRRNVGEAFEAYLAENGLRPRMQIEELFTEVSEEP